MVSELVLSIMEIFIQVVLKMEKEMVMGHVSFLMEVIIKENGLMI